MIVFLDISEKFTTLLKKTFIAANNALLQRNIPPIKYHVFLGSLDELINSWKSIQPPNSKIDNFVICTPGNSLGFMNGGFDGSLVKSINGSSTKFQDYLLDKSNSYTPPGTVNKINLFEVLGNDYKNSKSWELMKIETILHCPTMIVPEEILDENMVFNCMWNIFNSTERNSNLIIPGFGTGYGSILLERAAMDMVAATILHKMEISQPLKRSLLILIYLGKQYQKLLNKEDIGTFEKVLNKSLYEEYRKFYIKSTNSWNQLFDCVKW